MPVDNLTKLLESCSTLRQDRIFVATQVRQHPEWFPKLLEHCFDTSYTYFYKAAWVLEFVLEKKPEFLFPYMDFFTGNLSGIRHESAIRPLAKICKQMAEIHVSNTLNNARNILKYNNISNIVEASFDWLISDTKVASKVYSMDTLYQLGRLKNPKLKWIHPALNDILEKNISNESAAYKAHAKKILR